MAEEPDTNRMISIDGQSYELNSLSETARNQLMNLQVTDQEISRLKQQLAIAQTARTAYANALKAELPEQ